MATTSTATALEVRAKIFLSYSTIDIKLAERLREKIHGDGIQLFYAPVDIPALRKWREELDSNIDKSDIFLLLYTSNSSESPEVREEVEKATRYGPEIWPVLESSAKIDAFFRERVFRDRQPFVLRTGEEEQCFELIHTEVNRHFPKAGEIRLDNCPYPGPQSFSSQFEDVFFGHKEAISGLLNAIEGNQRILMVHGPSGAGKTSLLTVGLGGRLRPRYFYTDPIARDTPYELLNEVLIQLSKPAESKSLPSVGNIVDRIIELLKQGEQLRYVLCFDQMENFFTGIATESYKQDVDQFLRSIQRLIISAGREVTVLISFRKESLADVQPHIKKYFRDNWSEQIIEKLSTSDARQCIQKPARLKGIAFDREVAAALLAALSKNEPVVNPMDLQKVCKRLWDAIAKSGEKLPLIDEPRLMMLSGGKKLKEGAERFVEDRDTGAKPSDDWNLNWGAERFVDQVLKDYLNDEIKDIAKSLGPAIAGDDPEEYVKLSLMEFVGLEKERLRVPETEETDDRRGKRTVVGRLSMDVLKRLINRGLVQSAGNKVYELAHDALAVEIYNHTRPSQSVHAMKNLLAVLSRSPESEFNQYSELLENLEPVRANNWHFKKDEVEFLIRCALGDKKKGIKGTGISIDAWVDMLIEQSPSRLIGILEQALATKDESVQLDAMDQLLKAKVRSRIDQDSLDKVGSRLKELSMDDQCSSEVREKACILLVKLGYEPGIDSLFDCFENSKTRSKATTALALMRHTTDTLQNASQSFRARWKSIGLWSRLRVLQQMLRWRWDQSSWWIFYTVAVCAPSTALGAIIPFVPMGYFGASLTMEDTRFGAAAGIFHGASGGIVWGFGTAAALLAYGVMWRGGSIRRTMRETVLMSLCASVGGFLAGIVNMALIVPVFVESGLQAGGWLDPVSKSGRFRQALLETNHGWIMPLFGAALGIGIGWSMARILSDSKEQWRFTKKVANPAEPSGAAVSDQVQATENVAVKQSLKRIVLLVLRESWRNVLWLAIGAVVIFFLIHPGSGVCDPSDLVAHKKNPGWAKACETQYQLPPKWARTAGLAVVILGGSLFLEVSFLFSLLSIQFGLDLKRNLKENRYFLRYAGARG